MKSLKLGIIGISEGNGHPYSWSAIFNGYNHEKMSHCPFPVIPEYLAKQTFPQAAITGAKVTHIWTQDKQMSRHIAEAALIDHVCEAMEDMIDQVDAVLLARDDAEHHVQMASPFIKAGLPVYIDKPITLKIEELEKLYDMQQYAGQIFTCSALQYADSFCLSKADHERLGKIRKVEAYIKNAWNKYAIHLIEPSLNVIGADSSWSHIMSHVTDEYKKADFRFEDGCELSIFTDMQKDVAPTIHIEAEHGEKTLVIEDYFTAFKAALVKFSDGIRYKRVYSDPVFVKNCVNMIEKGNEGFK